MRDIFQQRTVLSTDFISVSDFTQALQQVATDRTAAITLAIEASSQNQAQQTAADISNAIALSQDLLRGEYSNKIDWNSFGAPYGVAPLDANGLVPPGNLPAFSTDSVGEGFNLFFTNERAALAAPVQTVAGRIGDVVLSVSDITGAVAVSSVGAADGIATLDGNGKLTTAQIPASLIGALNYQGVWNASTNTPALTSSVGEKGQYFKVSNAGTTSINGITQWGVGDVIVFNGTTWDRIDGGATEVTSVAGRVGAVVLAAADISGLSTVATTGNYSDLSGKPAIPSKLSDLTNDTNYIAAGGAPVQSVAGKTGVVTLTATDISGISTAGKTGSYTDLTNKPTSLSQFTNNTNFITSSGAPVQSVAGRTGAVTLTVADVANAVSTASLGVASGVATLDASGKLTNAQIPPSLIGGLNYQGVWNASTNSPAIVSSVGTKGHYYKVSVRGTVTINAISQWEVGDIIVFNGSTWDRIDGGATEVTSVAGKTGAVALTAGDITGLSTVALTGSYTDLTDKPTIPTQLSQLTNNTSFITSAGAPVQSVAGKTGAVTLTAADISGISTAGKTGRYTDLINKPTIPTAVSQLTNDSSFIKADGTVWMSGEFYCAKKAGTSDAANSVASVHVRNNDGTGDTDLAAINFQCGVNYSTKLYLRSDGYFGIGGGSRNAWALYLDASSNLVAAGDITAYSDPRLKENIKPLAYASDKLETLGVYNFTWKYNIPHIANKAGNADTGLLATEVEEVFPDFVTESIEIDGQYYKTVNYIKFIPVLIQAFKEMKIELETLKQKVN